MPRTGEDGEDYDLATGLISGLDTYSLQAFSPELRPMHQEQTPQIGSQISLQQDTDTSDTSSHDSWLNQPKDPDEELQGLQQQKHESKTSWRDSKHFKKLKTCFARLVNRLTIFFLGDATGWRRGIRANMWFAGIVGLVNIFTTILVPAIHGLESQAISYVTKDSCSKISHSVLAIHLIINILSTLLLAASNYTMQILVSPTRAQVDAAHRRRRWLDIGLPSFKNLAYLPKRRLLLWLAIGLSSMPIHLLYNSAFFESITAYDYVYSVVTEEFFNASTPLVYLSNGQPQGSQVDLNALKSFALNSSMEKHDPTACMTEFATNYVSDYDLVFLVTNQAIVGGSTNEGANLTLNMLYAEEYTSTLVPYFWICGDQEDDYSCTLSKAKAAATDSWNVSGYPIDHCMVRKAPQLCQLNFSLPIMIIIIAANLCKLAVMWLTSRIFDDPPLVTIGDAAASFLSEPDDTTIGMCLMSKKEIEKGFWEHPTARPWQFRRHRWFRATSLARWLISNTFFLIGIGIGTFYVIFITLSLHYLSVPMMMLGFGEINDQTILSMRGAKLSTLGAIVVANAPQAIFSCFYMAYNGLFTGMAGAAEWDGYGSTHKSLRVTNPSGKQRSTYYLQLPYRFAIPLVLFSALLHWLISESLFFTKVSMYTLNGTLDDENSISMPGFSPLPILTSLIMCIVAVVVVNFIGLFWHYSSAIPLAGNCSAAISAACHTEPENMRVAPYLPVRWGVIRAAGDDIGHCGLSIKQLSDPERGKLYAGKSAKTE